mgnify:CR=1 FL=1
MSATKEKLKSTLRDRYENKVIAEMVKLHGYKNPMDVPKIVKVVLNRGLGEATSNAKVVELSVCVSNLLTGKTASSNNLIPELRILVN